MAGVDALTIIPQAVVVGSAAAIERLAVSEPADASAIQQHISMLLMAVEAAYLEGEVSALNRLKDAMVQRLTRPDDHE